MSTPSERAERLREALGRDDFSPGLDALAGVARYGHVEDGRLNDIRRLYSQLVDLRTTLRTPDSDPRTQAGPREETSK